MARSIPRRKRLVKASTAPSAADLFKERFGWKPSTLPFHTTANRQCGGCKAVKPGSEFDVPVTPGMPDLNVCRVCS